MDKLTIDERLDLWIDLMVRAWGYDREEVNQAIIVKAEILEAE